MAEMLVPLDMLSLDDPLALAFKRRNNIHIYISDELIFGRNPIVYPFNLLLTSHNTTGFRSSQHITLGNLFNALNAGLYFNIGFDSLALVPRNSESGESAYIPWNVNNRNPIKFREYDVVSGSFTICSMHLCMFLKVYSRSGPASKSTPCETAMGY
jgi:hypothetical protein